MFSSKKKAESHAKLAALDRVQAVIEFDLNGRILAANENFQRALGYEASEIIGQHHSMFVEPSFRNSPDYTAFWDRLRRGEFQAGQFQRRAKDGRTIWIEASYNPILDRKGRPCKIVKFATDITRQKSEDADRAGQMAAIRKAQAVIEFDLDGHILDANDNFLGAVGYRLDEIKDRHHSIFVDAETRVSSDYADFWAALNRGEYQAAQYRRFGKDGREIWIEASYNPILNSAGKPYKVVKFATDITRQVALLSDLRHMIDTNFLEIDQALGRSLNQSGEAINIASSTSGNMQAVAAAAEELATSVGEIAGSMARSREATDNAFAAVSSVGGFTSRLSEAASNMGGIVGLIQNIAAQINLLALNATIESARAGDAGRGFAVVAQEVKNLANQAAKATDQIANEINGLQTISHDVVSTLENIKSSVGVMRDSVITTATAVEEQSAVTRDMSSNMQETADAVATMAGNVTAISAAVSQVSTAVSTTRDAARVLAR